MASPLRPLTNRRQIPDARTESRKQPAVVAPQAAVPSVPLGLDPNAKMHHSTLQRALLMENCLETLNWQTLLCLAQLSKEWKFLALEDEETATTIWRIVCKNFAKQNGLFCPRSGATGNVSFSEWRRVFVDDLWQARKKWCDDQVNSENETHVGDNTADFKIKVSVRFRACEENSSSKKLELPLHQLLKLRRHQRKGSVGKGRTSSREDKNRKCIAFGGRKSPPQKLLDAMTSKLLVEPRRFPSSRKVMDLRVILPMLQRDPHDPFDGTPCSMSDLLKCPVIEKELAAWNHSENQQDGPRPSADSDKGTQGLNSVGLEAVKKMAESGAELSPEVLEMLLDAEQLQQQLQQAEANAQRQDHTRPRREERFLNDSTWATSNASTNDMDEDIPASIAGLNEEAQVTAHPTNALFLRGNGEDVVPPATSKISERASRRKRDQPRLLSVQKSRVNFFVPGTGVRKFHFPLCFDCTSTQRQVYSQCARSTVMAALNGISSCVLAYGQTGSGKTFTHFGPEGWTKTLSSEMRTGRPLTTSGCVIRGIVDIVAAMKEARQHRQFSLSVSATYTQVYNNRVSDLLTGRACSVARESGEITGAKVWEIQTIDDAICLLKEGEKRKTFEATAMNGRSSRAHTIFALTLTQVRRHDGRMVRSNLFFVDLAGSERVKKSKVRGGALTQAIGINQSLSVLGRVIKDLMAGNHHVPYLESRLTTMLRQCFGGNCLTRVLVNCRSDQNHSEESLNSLRFGERCSRISNQVVFATSSVDAALAQVDEALRLVDAGLQSLAERGLATQSDRGSGNAWNKLKARKEMLCLKRKDLAKLSE